MLVLRMDYYKLLKKYAARRTKIHRLLLRGLTFTAIAKIMGITKQRVSQIVNGK